MVFSVLVNDDLDSSAVTAPRGIGSSGPICLFLVASIDGDAAVVVDGAVADGAVAVEVEVEVEVKVEVKVEVEIEIEGEGEGDW